MREPQPIANRLHGQIVAGAFRPHPWFASPHAQTLLPVLRPLPRVGLRIERRELPDGDFVDIGWWGETAADRHDGSRPLAVLLHGLSGGFDSKYARGLALQLMARGWRGVILQFRGAGPEPNRLPRSYHHGDTEDLRELLQLLREREPDTPMFAVGWSLGGNVLLKYLGEEGPRTPLAAAVGICAPFQLEPCAQRLRTGFSRVYQNHLMAQLKRMIRRKYAKVPMQIDLARVLAARDFFEFDDAVTAIVNGFQNARDYYEQCSSGRFLRGIARPTLIIHALDDPFMVPEIVPEPAQLAPEVTLEVCERGGHVGFVEAGPRYEPRFWLERRIPEYLEERRRAPVR